MGAKDVFISYKAEEFAQANWVKESLERQGISCWMAPASIPGGSSYAAEIPAAIRNCKVYVLILSKMAQTSKWIPRELDQAINDNKTIMPFMLENCELKDDFKFYLTNVQRYAAYENKAAAMEKMTYEIKILLGMPTEVINDEVAEVPTTELQSERQTVTQKPQKPQKQTPRPKKPEQNKIAGKKLPIPKHYLIIGAAVIGVILLAIILGNVILSVYKANTIVVAGERYGKSETSLYLENQGLTSADIRNIGQLEELITLQLKNCVLQSDDIGQMLHSELVTLELSDCQLTEAQIASLDFSGLELYSLNLSGNASIASLEFISSLESDLFFLDISDTSVSNLSLLTTFTNLTELRANHTSVSELPAFPTGSKLLKLCVNDNQLQSLEGLENCIELQTLQAGNNAISSIDGLQNATQLQFVFLNDNRITDISVLSKSYEHIGNLYLKNNQISDISPLETCVNLSYLALDDNDITALTSLQALSKLTGLSLSGNKIESTEGIENLPELLYVNLADNALTGIGGIGDRSALLLKAEDGAVLDFSGNPVTNVNIAYSGKFRCLALLDCAIQDYSFLYATSGSNLILAYDPAIDFSALAATGYYQYSLIGCPLDQQIAVRELLGSYNTTFVERENFAYSIDDYLPDVMKGVPEYYR